MAKLINGKQHSAVSLRDAAFAVGGRTLWKHLDFDVAPGEFVAILGPNGAGKTSLLKASLKLAPLAAGTITIAGAEPRRGSSIVGYVPQQKIFDVGLGLRGHDLVMMGINGHRFGMPWPSRSVRSAVDAAIEAVGATAYASVPIGRLPGGEQQRLRIAQSLISNPSVLLCDEPLTSLDLNQQEGVLDLLDSRRRTTNTAILMVTHEINLILPLVDYILYLVAGKWAIGTPDEILTSERLTALYNTPIDVLWVHGGVVVVGGEESPNTSHHCGDPEMIAL